MFTHNCLPWPYLCLKSSDYLLTIRHIKLSFGALMLLSGLMCRAQELVGRGGLTDTGSEKLSHA